MGSKELARDLARGKLIGIIMGPKDPAGDLAGDLARDLPGYIKEFKELLHNTLISFTCKWAWYPIPL